MTDRTQVISPPEHSQHSTIYNQNYGYGYGYATTHTTKQTGAHHHVSWNSNSKDADYQTQIQLTARPHESTLYGSNISSRKLQWPKVDDKDKKDGCCKCECC